MLRTLRPLRLCSTSSRRLFSTTRTVADGLRIGFVPEHFSTPIYFASKHYGLSDTLISYPSGTGHMIQSLQSNELDIGIGLTEGWVAALAKVQIAKEKAAFSIVGTYVETPLCWAISTGAKRDFTSAEQLRGKRIGVSRVGSGSYVMAFVLADQMGWLEKGNVEAPFIVVPLNTFAKLREGVNSGEADFFMWEHFTSKRYYDTGEIKRIGEIYTPWSSWKIVAREPKDERVKEVLGKINRGIRHFEEHQEEAVKYISTDLDYSKEDAREWLKTVRFAADVRGVDIAVVEKTIEVLEKAGVVGKGVNAGEMIGLGRSKAVQWL